ncbi:V-snare-domain-containing protein [Trichodelitschia bisporula]|uniref:Protein transport protein BOS1 n=1 Tax=Trichodelitschia bisporula TaxID=703511 RepID=A0A6G1I258_9PEZI|nr:V-snare-domain-containing protein [Trichodelitschia bisporula]
MLPDTTSIHATGEPVPFRHERALHSVLRQGSSIRRDLDTLAEGAQSSPALLGQINASLASFSRTIDDYNKLAFERVKTFRAELTDYRARLEHTKREAEETQTTQARTELLGRRPHHAATPENPYAGSSTAQGRYGGHASAFGAAPADAPREAHALREQTFFQQTHTQIDEFLERGADVLAGLGQQREMLKGTQRKLYSVGNTLGISGHTIRRVERRAWQDKWIFWGGSIVTSFALNG